MEEEVLKNWWGKFSGVHHLLGLYPLRKTQGPPLGQGDGCNSVDLGHLVPSKSAQLPIAAAVEWIVPHQLRPAASGHSSVPASPGRRGSPTTQWFVLGRAIYGDERHIHLHRILSSLTHSPSFFLSYQIRGLALHTKTHLYLRKGPCTLHKWGNVWSPYHLTLQSFTAPHPWRYLNNT